MRIFQRSLIKLVGILTFFGLAISEGLFNFQVTMTLSLLFLWKGFKILSVPIVVADQSLGFLQWRVSIVKGWRWLTIFPKGSVVIWRRPKNTMRCRLSLTESTSMCQKGVGSHRTITKRLLSTNCLKFSVRVCLLLTTTNLTTIVRWLFLTSWRILLRITTQGRVKSKRR